MTHAQQYVYPLHLPRPLKEMAARMAQEDGVSLNQWIVAAVAQKIGAVQPAQALLTEYAGKFVRGHTAAGQGVRRADVAGRRCVGRIAEVPRETLYWKCRRTG